MPPSVLFWRSLTHWLGGMGIIVLTLAILPLLGIGGMQLFQAEMPGPTKDRLAPRIQDTARILWSVYVLFTLVEILLLLLGGIDFFDAVCHAFATLATGGFSTHNDSVGYFNSINIEAVIIVFMFLAGINFSLHYQGLRGRWSAYWQNEEFRFYLGLTSVAVVIIVVMNFLYNTYGDIGENIRTASFQVVSILTTTGFGTADFDQWPPICKILLVTLMFVGGCAGSTGGGMKHVRILLFFKYARLQLRNLVHPHAVGTIKLGKVKVPKDVMISILGFFALYYRGVSARQPGGDRSRGGYRYRHHGGGRDPEQHRARPAPGRTGSQLRRSAGTGQGGPDFLYAGRTVGVVHRGGAPFPRFLENGQKTCPALAQE